jgi:hypothetical protein
MLYSYLPNMQTMQQRDTAKMDLKEIGLEGE